MASELSQAERTAIRAYVDSHGTGTHEMFLHGAEAGWRHGRDYGREREEKLRLAEHQASVRHQEERIRREKVEGRERALEDALEWLRRRGRTTWRVLLVTSNTSPLHQ